MTSSNPLSVAAILSDPRWYGDGDVTWDDAPNAAQTERQAIARIKRLRRKPQKHPRPDFAQLTIADALAGCGDRHRCLNGACPQCARAFQRWLAYNIVSLANAGTSS